jgi:hypothetical protein
MGTGVALADSKRGRADFGSTGADALRSAADRRPGEQSDYKTVPADEHGDHKTVTCGSQRGYMAVTSAGVARMRRRPAPHSRHAVQPLSGFLVEHKEVLAQVREIGQEPIWLLGFSCKTPVAFYDAL